jgi:hypothetical protein
MHVYKNTTVAQHLWGFPLLITTCTSMSSQGYVGTTCQHQSMYLTLLYQFYTKHVHRPTKYK